MTLVGCTEPTMGDVLRDQALKRVLEHVPPADPWRRQACELIAKLAAEQVVFEAYDLIRAGLPEPDHHSRWGAVFNICARNGLIEIAGYGPSARPTTKSSAVRFWRGTP